MVDADLDRIGSAGRHVLLTGVTGFVGQALLERILVTTDDRITVLVRRRGTHTAAHRVARLLDGTVFDAWRGRVGADAIRCEFHRRVTVLEGDLTDPPPLPRDLDAVVHSASSVNFDDPIDAIFEANVEAPRRLYAALAAAGVDPHVVHVSTAYVWTGRTALAPETSVPHDVDWRAELASARRARARLAPASDRETVERLRELGRLRAEELGWTDAYTMTKALGERVAEELWRDAGHRLTVLRPTIIESAHRLPHPGWIDGFKVADPLIAAYARGELLGFPGRPDGIIDIVPVDHVVAAALAALDHPKAAGDYLQVGSGVSNPLVLRDVRAHVMAYFAAHPWVGRDGVAVRPRPWEFSEPGRLHAWLERRAHLATWGTRALARMPRPLRAHGTRLEVLRRRLVTMQRFVRLYEPYTCARTVYDDAATRRLMAAGTDAPAVDVRDIDWARYLHDGHLPALVELMSRRSARPRPAGTDAAPTGARGLGRRAHGGRARSGADQRTAA